MTKTEKMMNKTSDLKLNVRSDCQICFCRLRGEGEGGLGVAQINVCQSVWEHTDPFVDSKKKKKKLLVCSLFLCLSSSIWALSIDWVSRESLTSNLATVFYSFQFDCNTGYPSERTDYLLYIPANAKNRFSCQRHQWAFSKNEISTT